MAAQFLCTPAHLFSNHLLGECDKFRRSQAAIRNHAARILVRAGALGGDFGARDPFPAEIASNFGDKVLGNENTDHVILIPHAAVLGLSKRSCKPVVPGQAPFSPEEAKCQLRKVVGWRLIDGEAGLKLQCEWKLKDHAAGLELLRRLSPVTEAEGKPLELHLDDQSHVVRAEIWTESIGGLCENDFILAAKIDQVKTSDLIKKNRFWA